MTVRKLFEGPDKTRVAISQFECQWVIHLYIFEKYITETEEHPPLLKLTLKYLKNVLGIVV